MVIDAHIHLTESGRWFNTNHNAHLMHYIKLIEHSRIEKALILPIFPYISNRFVFRVCSMNPDKFFGFASVDPLRSDAPTTLKKEIEDFDLKGLKLHPRLQKFELLDPNVLSTIEMASYLEVPVLIDTWFEYEAIYAKFVTSIKEVVRQFPDLKLILPHLGGPAPNTFFDNDNISLDLSFILSRIESNKAAAYVEQLIKRIGPSRLIYGSDFPEMNPITYLNSAEALLDNLNLSSAVRDKIFKSNILELCNIE